MPVRTLQVMTYLGKMMLPHIQHLWVHDWQTFQERQCLAIMYAELQPEAANSDELPEHALCKQWLSADVGLHLDFGALHSTFVGKAPQELNWVGGGGETISVLGICLTLNVSQIDADKLNVRRVNGCVRIFVTCLSLDTTQDPAIVWVSIIWALRKLRTDFGVIPRDLHAFSDNCAGQFKCKLAIALIVHCCVELKMSITWSFGQPRHCKCLTDALTSRCEPG